MLEPQILKRNDLIIKPLKNTCDILHFRTNKANLITVYIIIDSRSDDNPVKTIFITPENFDSETLVKNPFTAHKILDHYIGDHQYIPSNVYQLDTPQILHYKQSNECHLKHVFKNSYNITTQKYNFTIQFATSHLTSKNWNNFIKNIRKHLEKYLRFLNYLYNANVINMLGNTIEKYVPENFRENNNTLYYKGNISSMRFYDACRDIHHFANFDETKIDLSNTEIKKFMKLFKKFIEIIGGTSTISNPYSEFIKLWVSVFRGLRIKNFGTQPAFRKPNEYDESTSISYKFGFFEFSQTPIFFAKYLKYHDRLESFLQRNEQALLLDS